MDPVCRIFGKKAGAVGARSQEMSKSYLAEPSGPRVAVADAVLVRDFDPGRSMTPALLEVVFDGDPARVRGDGREQTCGDGEAAKSVGDVGR